MAAPPALKVIPPGHTSCATYAPDTTNYPPAPGTDLRTVAATGLNSAESEFDSIVVMGWSGGGPYALAAGSLNHPSVRGVCLLSSWATMNPPDSGLPLAVRAFMRFGRWAPRPVLRASLSLVGLRTAGNVDDVRRVARPWGFDPTEVAEKLPVAVWHSQDDREVPIGPWDDYQNISINTVPGCDHRPSAATWRAAMAWAQSLLA